MLVKKKRPKIKERGNAMGFITDILNSIQANLPLIVIGLVVLMAIRSGFFGRVGGALSSTFGHAVPAVAMVVLALIVMFGIITIFKPQFYSYLWGPGPFGPGQQVRQADANLTVAVLDPLNTPDKMNNPVAHAAADAVVSKYKLEAARNYAEISAAEAERLCRLPKGHPDRAGFDAVGIDPCAASLPASIQAAAKTVAQIDIDAAEKNLSQPIGTPPTGSENWLRQFYFMPKGAIISVMLLLLLLITGRMLRSVFR